jgi:hypothetical protein
MKPIKPAGKSVNAPSWLRIVIEIIVIAIFTGLLAVVLVEWAVGCGEPWTDAQGVEHTGQCVFLPNKGESK